jgi:hypothetical protein
LLFKDKEPGAADGAIDHRNQPVLRGVSAPKSMELPMRKLVIAAAAIAAVSAAVIAPAEARWRHGHHRGNCLAWYYTVCR